jgi:hypothetical protein
LRGSERRRPRVTEKPVLDRGRDRDGEAEGAKQPDADDDASLMRGDRTDDPNFAIADCGLAGEKQLEPERDDRKRKGHKQREKYYLGCELARRGVGDIAIVV